MVIKMKNIVLGIIAHVDAGKTTLSEGLLYNSGALKSLGRVDNKDTFLDTEELEKDRGITIFSKEAVINYNDIKFTLLDTPGHVDFSSEMERTLSVLDYCILVINGAEGVQGHTKTIWKLLDKYNIPVLVFVNKTDMPGFDKTENLRQLDQLSGEKIIDFSEDSIEEINDSLALLDEDYLNQFMELGSVSIENIVSGIKQRKIIPCYFGSALKNIGVEYFLNGISKYTKNKEIRSSFSARVYKVSRDEQGNRLTHMKITGGSLCVKDVLNDEKVNQIRIYSGNKYETVKCVESGTICQVMGLVKTFPGQGLGEEKNVIERELEPVLTYKMELVDGEDPRGLISKFKEIEDEDPELKIHWDEELKEIHIKIMGEVQLEVLKSIIKQRYNLNVLFSEGSIVYKETIQSESEGVGHFEPLKHYAEVHLLLEPGKRNTGIRVFNKCRDDILGKNFQNLIITHIKEKEHRGVLTGSQITDIDITLVSGRDHNKHTEGGDFREAVYRAIRQGLMKVESRLLEPYYAFELEIPESMVGRAMLDIERMGGSSELLENRDGKAGLRGRAPVSTMVNYQREVTSYTKGEGRLSLEMAGYDLCHNEEEIIKEKKYDPENDIENTPDSVFCSHGSGFIVKWNEVEKYMHLPSIMNNTRKTFEDEVLKNNSKEISIGTDEIDEIINKTFYSNSGDKSNWKKIKRMDEREVRFYDSRQRTKYEKLDEYVLIDGYNVIYAWNELKCLMKESFEGARGRLLDIMCNYQGIKKCQVIVVFDAYKVEGDRREVQEYNNIHVVYTKKAETADSYIERFSFQNKNKYKIKVVTSDRAEQMIVIGNGASTVSAQDFYNEVVMENEKIMELFREKYSK